MASLLCVRTRSTIVTYHMPYVSFPWSPRSVSSFLPLHPVVSASSSPRVLVLCACCCTALSGLLQHVGAGPPNETVKTKALCKYASPESVLTARRRSTVVTCHTPYVST